MSRIRVERITDKQGTGAPLFPNGIRVVGLTSLSNVVAGITTVSDLTATGNVSIGGTLTYEDVTNVDSIGIITARDGIKVTGGKVIVGNNPTVAADTLLHVEKSTENNVVFEGNTTTIGARLQLQNNNTAAGALNQIDFNDAGGQGTSSIKGFNTDQTNNYGELAFFTRNAQGSPAAERLRIGKDGQLGLSGANYGTSGQVLTSGGASAAVQWATPAAGAWSVLTSQDIATNYGQSYWESKSWDVTNYSTYRYIFNQVAVSGGNFDLDIRFYYTPYSNGSASGAESLQSGSDYNFYYDRRRLNGSGSGSDNQQQDAWRLGGTNSAETWNVDHTVALSPPTYTNIKSVYGKTFYYAGGQLWRTEDDCCLFWHQEGYITGVRVYHRGGTNLQHGRFQVLRMSKT